MLQTEVAPDDVQTQYGVVVHRVQQPRTTLTGMNKDHTRYTFPKGIDFNLVSSIQKTLTLTFSV